MIEQRHPIMIMAGGTGGHVFPALAVANYLRELGEPVVWMGTQAGIEARLVPQANIPIEWLKVQGLRGKGWVIKTLAPFRLLQACWQAMSILRRHQPRAVLGMGGFASGPGGLMAWLLRIPLVIHEQNAVMGLTNRLLSRLARLSFFAFAQAAEGVRGGIVCGNPVRPEILQIPDPASRFKHRTEKQPLRLLVIGGSLGARALNQTVPMAIARLEPENRPEIRHQCGDRHLQHCIAQYRDASVDAEICAFIEDMKGAYEWADLVVCRAGALTVSELAAAGVAAILVPFPYAVDDHQFANAGLLVDAGAALRVRENDFSAEWLAEHMRGLIANRGQLIDMAVNARAVASIDAVEQVARGVLREART